MALICFENGAVGKSSVRLSVFEMVRSRRSRIATRPIKMTVASLSQGKRILMRAKKEREFFSDLALLEDDLADVLIHRNPGGNANINTTRRAEALDKTDICCFFEEFFGDAVIFGAENESSFGVKFFVI